MRPKLFAITLGMALAGACSADAADTQVIHSTTDARSGVRVTCTYRDWQRVEIKGLIMSFGAPGQVDAVGATREEAVARMVSTGYGTKENPCLAVRVSGQDGHMLEAMGRFDSNMQPPGTARTQLVSAITTLHSRTRDGSAQHAAGTIMRDMAPTNRDELEQSLLCQNSACQ